jgi:hypothetical protein
VSTIKKVRYKLLQPVVGCIKGYRVGDDGSVWTRWKRIGLGRGHGSGTKRVFTNTWRQLPQSNHRYRHVYLRMSTGTLQALHVHILVLAAFRGPRPPGMQARHSPDHDKHNNKLDNLWWGTPQENADDRIADGDQPRGSDHGMAKLTEVAVLVIRRRWSKERQYNPHLARQLAAKYGVDKTLIIQVVRRRIWTHI